MDFALKEIERCVQLGLKVLCLPTHFLNAKGEWLSTAESDIDQIYELANKYRLAVQIHPYDGGENDSIKKSILAFSFSLDDGTMR